MSWWKVWTSAMFCGLFTFLLILDCLYTFLVTFRKDIYKSFFHHCWLSRPVCLLLWASILQMWWVVWLFLHCMGWLFVTVYPTVFPKMQFKLKSGAGQWSAHTLCVYKAMCRMRPGIVLLMLPWQQNMSLLRSQYTPLCWCLWRCLFFFCIVSGSIMLTEFEGWKTRRL